MKRLLLIFGAITLANIILAQPCISDHLIINSQAQIDDFSTTYPECKEVLGSIIIMSDEATPIKDLEGLESIEFVRGDLHILANDELTNLTGLRSLSMIGGNLLIRDNASLTTLSGLERLLTIRQDFTVRNNDALVGFAELPQLSTIGKDLTVVDNDALVGFTGLESLSNIHGNVEISDNSTLSHLYGLENLTSIGENLYVNSNAELSDFNGLDNLQSINNNLRIRNNQMLTNIEALQSLQIVRGDIRIAYNNALNSLAGLQSIDYQYVIDLGVYENTNLSTCGLTNICDYLSAGHSANVYQNAINCNSSDEIMITCSQVTATNTPETSELAVFPIPSNDVIYLQLAPQNTDVKITISNLVGKTIHQQTIGENTGDSPMCFDITEYLSGIYFLSVYDGHKTLTKRFVKN